MRTRNVLAAVSALAIVLATTLFADADSNIRLFINGREVILDYPPITVGGRVLVPLHGVFEQLGAVLAWENPVTHAIIVSRDVAHGRGPEVRLMLGSRQGMVNDLPVTLDVPPIAIGGRVFIPLRFVSEALGAKVSWDPIARVVWIVPGPPLPAPAETLPTPPKGGLAEGIVVRVDLTTVPQQIVITWPNQTQAFTIGPGTALVRHDLNTNRVESIPPQQIFPGDAVRLFVEVGGGPPPRGTIRHGEVIVREVSGRVQAVTDRTLLLSDGRSFTLAEGVRVIVGGRITSGQDLVGRQVILRIQPLTGEITEIELMN